MAPRFFKLEDGRILNIDQIVYCWPGNKPCIFVAVPTNIGGMVSIQCTNKDVELLESLTT